jgi:hypothetical protein
MTSRTIPSIDFRVWSSQLGTIDSFTDDLLKRLENTTDTVNFDNEMAKKKKKKKKKKIYL